MSADYREGDLVVIADGWHDLFCHEGQVGIVLGVHFVSRTLGEGDREGDDPFLFLLIDGRKLTVSVDAVRHLSDEIRGWNK